MKNTTIFSFFTAAGIALALAACNNNSDTAATTTDSGSTSTATTTTSTSTRNYSAMADSFRTNSKAGYYLDPHTGKSVNLSIDTATGSVTNVTTGKPIRRYVDKRSWWVYDAASGDTLGSARMEKGSLRYRGDNDKWMTYEEKWKDAGDDNMSTNGNAANTGTDSMNNSSSSTGNGNVDNSNTTHTQQSGTSGNSGTGATNMAPGEKMKIKTDEHKVKIDDKGVHVKH